MNGLTAKVMSVALLAALCLVVFAQTMRFGFVGYDDILYVTENEMVLQGLTWASVRASLTYMDIAEWQPLTFMSHMLDVELFGLNASGHHAVNVLWHTLNAVLVFALVRRMTGHPLASLAVAALFAIHPYQAEPVAWVASRKDLLYTALMLGTFLCYVDYVKRRSWPVYTASVLLAWLAFTAKPSAILIPFYLVLFDYWPLERAGRGPAWGRFLRTTALDKLPFVLLTIVGLANTVYAGETLNVTNASEAWPLPYRLANAAILYTIYLRKIFWPTDFSAFYPHPGVDVSLVGAALSFVLLLVLSFYFYRSRQTGPHLFVGWCWFLIALVPVIGLIPIGTHRMADRYMYLSLLGPTLAVVASIAHVERRRTRRIAAAVFVVWLVALMPIAYRQAGVWRDPRTLWTHALHVDPSNALAWNNLGSFYMDQGEVAAALPCLESAVRHAPHWGTAQGNLADAYLVLARPADAIPHLEAALRADPDDVRALNSLGVSLLQLGRNADARAVLETLVNTDADSAEYRYHFGIACLAVGDTARAASEFEAALEIEPNYAPAHDRLAEMGPRDHVR